MRQQTTKLLGYCIASYFLKELSRNLALNQVTVFRSYVFLAIFIQENIAATGNDNDTEQNIRMDPGNLEEDGNITTSLLSVLSAMQENLTSSNSMPRDLVQLVEKKNVVVHRAEFSDISGTFIDSPALNLKAN